METIAQAEALAHPQAALGAYTPAGFWIRWLAIIVDGLILTVIGMPFTFMEAFLSGGQESFIALYLRGQTPSIELVLIGAAIFSIKMTVSYFYMAWFYKEKGGTPGKLLFDLRVFDVRTGAYLSYKKTFTREMVGKMISMATFLIGFIMAAFRSDKKALHDLMTGTQVLKKRK